MQKKCKHFLCIGPVLFLFAMYKPYFLSPSVTVNEENVVVMRSDRKNTKLQALVAALQKNEHV